MPKWLAIMLCICSFQLQGQSADFYVWQGFEHHWGYNHRLNRLGDAVVQNEAGKWEWLHTAASGSGADLGEFTGYAAAVQQAGVSWRTGMVTLEVEGGEMAELRSSTVVRLDFPSQNDLPAVLLNGFDVQAAPGADADKLGELELGVDSVWREEGQLAFRMYCRVVLSCSSPECARGDKAVAYVADLHWLVVDASADAVAVARASDYRRSGPVQGPQGVDVQASGSVHGFQRIGFGLSAEDHVCDYWMGIRRSESLLMGLAQRKVGMRKNYRLYYHGFPKLPSWVAVKKKSGHARAWAEVVGLDLEAGGIQMVEMTGERFWDSSYRKPRPAGDSMAVYREHLPLTR